MKISSKTNEEPTPFVKNNIRERVPNEHPSIPNIIKNNINERVSNEHPSVPNIIKNIEETLIISVPNTKPTNTIEKPISPDQSQSVSNRIVILNSSKEFDVFMNSTSSEEISQPVEDTDQHKPTDTRLTLPPLHNKTEKSEIAFTEYKTPLTGIKSNQRQVAAF